MERGAFGSDMSRSPLVSTLLACAAALPCAYAVALGCAGAGGGKAGSGGGGPPALATGAPVVRVTRIPVDGGMATRAEAAWNGRGYGVFYNLGAGGDLYFTATDGVASRRIGGGWITGAASSGERYAATHHAGMLLVGPGGDVEQTLRFTTMRNPITSGPVRWNRDAGEWVASIHGYEESGPGAWQERQRTRWQVARFDEGGTILGTIEAGETCGEEQTCGGTAPVWNGSGYTVAFGGQLSSPTVVELDSGKAPVAAEIGAGDTPIADLSLARFGPGYALAFRHYDGLTDDAIVFALVDDGGFGDRVVLARATADRFVHSPLVYAAGDRAVVVWEEGPRGTFDGRLYFAVLDRDGNIVASRRRLDDIEQPQEWPHFVDAPQPTVVYIVGPQAGPGEIRVASIHL